MYTYHLVILYVFECVYCFVHANVRLSNKLRATKNWREKKRQGTTRVNQVSPQIVNWDLTSANLSNTKATQGFGTERTIRISR